MTDILEDLIDLHKQATTERSHNYVAACADRAIAEIKRLRSFEEDDPATLAMKIVIANAAGAPAGLQIRLSAAIARALKEAFERGKRAVTS